MSPLEAPSAPLPLRGLHSFPETQHVSVEHNCPTLPLRSCCEACYHSVDAALALGEDWKAHWSPGALRRHHERETCLFGVTRVWKPKKPDVGLAEALRVDEVEVKQRSNTSEPMKMNNRPLLPPPVPSENSEEEGEMWSSCEIAPGVADIPVPEEEEEEEGEEVAPPLHCSAEPVSIPKQEHYVLDPTLPDPDVLPISPSSSPQRQRSMSPPRRGRRPSLSAASVSLIRSSSSILKGVAAGIAGVGAAR